nr:hypothetical protein [Pseudoalteromonas sp. WY3]
MGKKSRLKKERKKASFTQKLFKKLVFIDGYNNPVYRFFPEKWQAESLCQGNVWISTLETCRKYEDPLQGDLGEATQTYKSGHIVGGSGDPAFVEMASRSGIHIGECAQILILVGLPTYSDYLTRTLCAAQKNSALKNYQIHLEIIA